MNCQKINKISKVLSVILFVLSFFPLTGLILPLINFVPFQALSHEAFIMAIKRGLLTLAICLTGGIGLWFLKKWAVYLVGIAGVVIIFLLIIKMIFIKIEIENDFIIIIPVILSVYILRNRKCF
jgi:uncharacterized membrane protein (DUF2068 family)